MENMLWKFISHRLANLVFGLAIMPIGSGKASEVGDGFNIPDDQMVWDCTALISKKWFAKKKTAPSIRLTL
jgi:hypothetical protein